MQAFEFLTLNGKQKKVWIFLKFSFKRFERKKQNFWYLKISFMTFKTSCGKFWNKFGNNYANSFSEPKSCDIL